MNIAFIIVAVLIVTITEVDGQATPVLNTPGFDRPGTITVSDFQTEEQSLWRGVAMSSSQLDIVESTGFDASEINPGENVVEVFDNLIPSGFLQNAAAPGIFGTSTTYETSDTYGLCLLLDNNDILFFGAPKRYAAFYAGPQTPPIFVRKSNVKSVSFMSIGVLGILYQDETVELLGTGFENSQTGVTFDFNIPTQINQNITKLLSGVYNIWFFKENTMQAFSKGYAFFGGLDPGATTDGLQLDNVRKVCTAAAAAVTILNDNSAFGFGFTIAFRSLTWFMPNNFGLYAGADPGTYIDCQGDEDFVSPSMMVYAIEGIRFISTNGLDLVDIPLQQGDFLVTGQDLIRINVNNSMRILASLPYNNQQAIFPLQVPNTLPVDNFLNSIAGTYARLRYGVVFISNYTTTFLLGRSRENYQPMNSPGQLLYGQINLTLEEIRAEDQLLFTAFTNKSVEVRGPGETPEKLRELYNAGIINFRDVHAGSQLVIAKTFPQMIVRESETAGPMDTCGPQLTDSDCFVDPVDGFLKCRYIDCAEGFQCSKSQGFICVERNLLPGEPCGNSANNPAATQCQPNVTCAVETASVLDGSGDFTICDGVFAQLRARVRVLTPENDTTANTLGCNTILDGVYDTCIPSEAFCDIDTRECVFNIDKVNQSTPVMEGQRCNVESRPLRYCPAGLTCFKNTCENRTEPRQIGQEADFKVDYCVPGAALAPSRNECIDPNKDQSFFNTQRILMLLFSILLVIPVVLSCGFFCSRRETLRILHENLKKE